MAADSIELAYRQLGVPAVTVHHPKLLPVVDMSVEQYGFASITSHACVVAPNVPGERPDRKQAGGERGLSESTLPGQAPTQ